MSFISRMAFRHQPATSAPENDEFVIRPTLGSVWNSACALSSPNTSPENRLKASLHLEEWDGPFSTPSDGVGEDLQWPFYVTFLLEPPAEAQNSLMIRNDDGPLLLLCQMLHARILRNRSTPWFTPRASEVQRIITVGAWKWTTPEGQEGSPHSAAVAASLARVAAAVAVRRDVLSEGAGASATYELVESSVRFQLTMSQQNDADSQVMPLHRAFPWKVIERAASELDAQTSTNSIVRKSVLLTPSGRMADLLARGLLEALKFLSICGTLADPDQQFLCLAMKAYAKWSSLAYDLRHDDITSLEHSVIPSILHLHEAAVSLGHSTVLSVVVAKLSGLLVDDVPFRASASLATSLSEVLASSASPLCQRALVWLVEAVDTVGFLTSVYGKTVDSKNPVAEEVAVALLKLACRLLESPVGSAIIAGRIKGWEPLIMMLSQGQTDPRHSVALVPLTEGVWVDLQDYPLNERHPQLHAEFFIGLAEELVNGTLIRNAGFVSWDQEMDQDREEWIERRKLSAEVLIESYYLLRYDLLDLLVQQFVMKESWNRSESGLWALRALSSAVVSWVSKKGSATYAEDRAKTLSSIRHLAWTMTKDLIHATALHPRMLAAVARFIAGYAPILTGNMGGTDNSPQTARLVTFLYEILKKIPRLTTSSSTYDPEEDDASVLRQIGFAARALLASWATYFEDAYRTAKPGSTIMVSGHVVIQSLPDIMVVSCQVGDAVAAAAVAEGVARALSVIPVKNRTAAAQSIFTPVLRGMDPRVYLPTPEGVRVHLGTLRNLVKFSDQIAEGMLDHPLEQILGAIWGLCSDMLNRAQISSNMEDDDLATLQSIFGLQEQVVVTMPGWLQEKRIGNLISATVRVYDTAHCGCALGMLGVTVEAFGGREEMHVAYGQLLAHLTASLCVYLKNNTLSNQTQVSVFAPNVPDP
mmetsp:Transcript_6948/g.15006  ORF Transcript_6948/g.15006 Transcript_6948/m.15006 type:complete len:929 (-) Transcript_6948:726-3512(-)